MNKKVLVAVILGVLVAIYIPAFVYKTNYTLPKINESDDVGVPAQPLFISTELGSEGSNEGDTSYAGWKVVSGDGYEFMHPGYFLNTQSPDYYAISLEPINDKNQEFSGMSIQKPEYVSNIDNYLVEYLGNVGPAIGSSAATPKKATKISLDGFEEAYMYEYESIASGYPQKLYALKSPYKNVWTVIIYPENDAVAEKVMKSFKFVEE
jgi:hypothetical protein